MMSAVCKHLCMGPSSSSCLHTDVCAVEYLTNLTLCLIILLVLRKDFHKVSESLTDDGQLTL